MGLQKALRALADPTRREILDLLRGGRMSAGEITEHFDVTAAASPTGIVESGCRVLSAAVSCGDPFDLHFSNEI